MDIKPLMMQELRFLDVVARCIKTRKFKLISSAHKGAAIKLLLPISPHVYSMNCSFWAG